jgi:hypothetical protein
MSLQPEMHLAKDCLQAAERGGPPDSRVTSQAGGLVDARRGHWAAHPYREIFYGALVDSFGFLTHGRVSFARCPLNRNPRAPMTELTLQE